MCAGLVVVILLSKNISQVTEKKGIYKALCDAFFVPGVLSLLFFALLFVVREGAFDGLAYATKNALSRLIPSGKKEIQKYTDYKAEKSAGREKKSSVIFLLVIGGVFFAASLVFFVLYKIV